MKMENSYDYLISNIDYIRDEYTDEYQTNLYIQKQMNNIYNIIKNNNINNIILDYNNNLLSYIIYNILNNCFQFLDKNKYNFLIYGKIKKTKKYIYNYKELKTINKYNLNKYNKNTIIISSFNSIYNVSNYNEKFKKFNMIISPLENMSYKEIRMALLFYENKNNKYLKDYKNFCNLKIFKNYLNELKNIEILELKDLLLFPNKLLVLISKDQLNNYEYLFNKIKLINSYKGFTIYIIDDKISKEEFLKNKIFLNIINKAKAPNKYNIFNRSEYNKIIYN